VIGDAHGVEVLAERGDPAEEVLGVARSAGARRGRPRDLGDRGIRGNAMNSTRVAPCWWTRTIVDSIEATQSRSSFASASDCTRSRSFAHTPALDHRSKFL
jgi:hypothetical protein